MHKPPPTLDTKTDFSYFSPWFYAKSKTLTIYSEPFSEASKKAGESDLDVLIPVSVRIN